MAKTYLILGATGHVGSATAKALLADGEDVIAIAHDAPKGEELRRLGAQVAVADVHDADALRDVFRRGQRLFLLNPPASPSTDTSSEERRSLASILDAVEGSGLERIVAESTYGAQPGEQVGDLGVLYEMERALGSGPIPVSIIRAAYYMSNWDAALAKAQGQVHTFYPADFALPMVAPEDLGHVAARLLETDADETGVHYVEGPERYSSADVAAAFAQALGRPVEAVSTPRPGWIDALKALGFSDPAAASMANMTAITLERRYEIPDDPLRGTVSLVDYVAGLVASGRRGRAVRPRAKWR